MEARILINDIDESSINSRIFLDYILKKGFNPGNYKTIWEINGSVKESMSQFLTDYNPYMVSKKTKYKDLEELNIKGTTGYLTEDGILIKDRFDNCNRLLYSNIRGFYQNHSMEYPQLNKNDVFIANGINTHMDNLINYNQDKFIGYCMDSDDSNLLYAFNRYKNLHRALNHNLYGNQYILEQDTYNNGNKSLLLIRKKKYL